LSNTIFHRESFTLVKLIFAIIAYNKNLSHILFDILYLVVLCFVL